MSAEEKVREVLTFHEACTVIRYSDDGSRTGFQCQCGAEDETYGELWGRDWLVEHQTQEIVKVL